MLRIFSLLVIVTIGRATVESIAGDVPSGVGFGGQFMRGKFTSRRDPVRSDQSMPTACSRVQVCFVMQREHSSRLVPSSPSLLTQRMDGGLKVYLIVLVVLRGGGCGCGFLASKRSAFGG